MNKERNLAESYPLICYCALCLKTCDQYNMVNSKSTLSWILRGSFSCTTMGFLVKLLNFCEVLQFEYMICAKFICHKETRQIGLCKIKVVQAKSSLVPFSFLKKKIILGVQSYTSKWHLKYIIICVPLIS